jgi:hypothetical protein
MPGSAIGRTTANDSASRPKKRNRWIANAISVPSTSATAVAPAPAFSDVISACWAPALPHASAHQRNVSPGGGQLELRSGLRELSRTRNSGT